MANCVDFITICYTINIIQSVIVKFLQRMEDFGAIAKLSFTC